jgi:hypothetical protein
MKQQWKGCGEPALRVQANERTGPVESLHCLKTCLVFSRETTFNTSLQTTIAAIFEA